jgi:DDE superfamily endonuclease
MPLSIAGTKACRERTPTRRYRRSAAKRIRYPATDKVKNRAISSERVPCENVIAMLKRFKIIADRYRNRRRRFGLRFFLIAAIYNMELAAA